MRRTSSTTLIVLLTLGVLVAPAGARSLNQVLPDLFGGNFKVGSALGVNVAGSSGIAISIPVAVDPSGGRQVPAVSSSSGFTYEFDPQLDLFVRTTESLGPIFSERAQTLGQGKFAVSFAYTHARFNTYEGANLNNISLTIPAGASVVGTPGNMLPGISDDVIQMQLKLGLFTDNYSFFFSYGVTDRLDVGLAVPLVYVDMSGTAQATIVDVNHDSGGFGALNRLVFDPKTQTFENTHPSQAGLLSDQQAIDRFSHSAFGFGDIFLRSKYRVLESEWADVAGALTVTIPTGGGDDFLGFKDFTATPLLILSKTFGFISPHVNGGYAFRSDRDVAQALWAAGADVRLFPWLTAVPDVLGFHDVDYNQQKHPIKDNIYQYSLGFKVNPFGQFVWGANFQFPLNRDGLRADVIYTTQLEYTF